MLVLTPAPLETAAERAFFTELAGWETGGATRGAVVAALPVVDGPMERRQADAVVFVPEGLAVVRVVEVVRQSGVVTALPEGAWTIGPGAGPGDVLRLSGGGSTPLDGLMRAGMDAAVRLRRAGLEPGRIARLTVLHGAVTGLLPADGDLGEGDQVALVEPRSLLLAIARVARHAGTDNPRLWTTADVRAALEALGLQGRSPSVEELNGEGFPYSPYVLRRPDLLTPAAMAAAPPRYGGPTAAPQSAAVPPAAVPPSAPAAVPAPAPAPGPPLVDPAAAARVAHAAVQAQQQSPGTERIAGSTAPAWAGNEVVEQTGGLGGLFGAAPAGSTPHPATEAAPRGDAPARERPAAAPAPREAPSGQQAPSSWHQAPGSWQQAPRQQESWQPASPPVQQGGWQQPATPQQQGGWQQPAAPVPGTSVFSGSGTFLEEDEPAGTGSSDRSRRTLLVVVASLVVLVLAAGGGVLLLGQTGGDTAEAGRTGTPSASAPATPAAPTVGGVQTLDDVAYTLQAGTTEPTCRDNSYGQVAGFFAATDCQQLVRALFSAEIDGLPVVIAVSEVEMPDAAAAQQLRTVANTDGTGNVNDLLREGVSYPGAPARLTDAAYDSLQRGSTVLIVEAAAAGPGGPPDAVLEELASDALGLELPEPAGG
ncbi:hypothetical protein GB931_09990 [Modestobacter sp. I12A-02628]|uniref:Uncharacterized protein n=1 Tax=Goekera deserti TaxID=2497753 RepID=A0A7K3WBH7_9ACTN|nr:hypothetical protein [Goekera deserti]MPQ98243.1 hypothetical protein [Goekera deserti]NDI48069.1 hypothetical protein [Goekera deserti]NEL53818.1 hypothetical protein [Goekera deserti]